MIANKSLIKFVVGFLAICGTFLSPLPGKAASRDTGEKGAKIYCYMRENGNSHEVSWNAAYALIKRQTNGLFKTSPKHGAVMIIESVVNNPTNFEGCGRYLGDLFGGNAIELEESINKNTASDSKIDNRYSY